MKLWTVIGAAVLMILTSAAPAAAYDREYQFVVAKDWATGRAFCTVAQGEPFEHPAVGCFGPSGDYVQPGDLKADGRRVGIQWRTSYGRYGLCVNARGKDAEFHPEQSFSPAQGEHMCNKDFREGTTITFRVGVCNGSKFTCKKIEDWRKWSPWMSVATDA